VLLLEASVVWLNVLLKAATLLLQISRSLLLLLWLQEAHKMEIEMGYLTQVITVLITQTQDALKKEILVQLVRMSRSRSSRHLLLLLIIGLGIRQDRDGDREIERGRYTVIKNKIPYLRKEASTFLALSAAAILLLLMTGSSLSLFNLVPAQAQSSVSFRTVQPAQGTLCTGEQAYLTFDAQGTTTSGSPILKMTGGTFQITDSSSSRQILYSGNIQRGEFNDNGQEAKISLA
jgi:hypothetical protein